MHQLWPQEVFIKEEQGKVLLYSCREGSPSALLHITALLLVDCLYLFSFFAVILPGNLTIWMIPVSPSLFRFYYLGCFSFFCSITAGLLLRNSAELALMASCRTWLHLTGWGQIKILSKLLTFGSSSKLLLHNEVINQEMISNFQLTHRKLHKNEKPYRVISYLCTIGKHIYARSKKETKRLHKDTE